MISFNLFIFLLCVGLVQTDSSNKDCEGTTSPIVKLPLDLYQMFYNFSFRSSQSDPVLQPRPSFQRDQCGISTNAQTEQIIGGTLSAPNAWPWAVYLVAYNGFVCAGTIIDRQWVLTAGHCYVGQKFDVMFGSHNLDKTVSLTSEMGFTPEPTGDEINKLRLSIPKVYPNNVVMDYSDYDIALLKLTSSFNFSESVRPVCLADSNDWDNSVCYINGWGDVETEGDSIHGLHQLRVELMNQKLCRGIHASYGLRDTGGSLCAIIPDLTLITAQDAGDALVCLRNGRYYLVGVTSHSIQILQNSYVNFFTRVTKHAHWIYDIVKNN